LNEKTRPCTEAREQPMAVAGEPRKRSPAPAAAVKLGRRGSDERETAGLAAARRALRARKGPVTDGDRPPPSTFPGKTTTLPGQLALYKKG
jgi:hypothetical protein